jgi:hypothetical protein
LLILIAQNKRLDALNATQNTAVLCKVPFLKKSRNSAKKAFFIQKKPFFAVFFKRFFKNGTM